MAVKIFVSYCEQDDHIVDYIKRVAEAERAKIIIDRDFLEPGDDIPSEIVEQIKSCDLFLLLLTKNSYNSKYVNNEIGVAVSNDKDILPVSFIKGPPPGMAAHKKTLPLYEDIEKGTETLRDRIGSMVRKEEAVKFGFKVFIGLAAIVWFLNRK